MSGEPDPDSREQRPTLVRWVDQLAAELNWSFFGLLFALNCVFNIFNGNRDLLGPWGALLEALLTSALGFFFLCALAWLLRRATGGRPPQP